MTDEKLQEQEIDWRQFWDELFDPYNVGEDESFEDWKDRKSREPGYDVIMEGRIYR